MKRKQVIIVVIIAVFFLLLGAYRFRPYRYEMGTFTSSLGGRTLGQKENIKMMLLQLDGKIIAPQRRFSFNDTMGWDLEKKGYWSEASFLEGQVVQEFGGGLCQVAGTLYGASVLSGLEVIERHSHSKSVSSLPSSLDATIKWGALDLQIENPYLFPVKIRSRVKAGQILIGLYGELDIKSEQSFTREKFGQNLSRLQRIEKNRFKTLSVDTQLEE